MNAREGFFYYEGYMNIPTLAVDLIDELDKLYPQPKIKPGCDMDEVMYKQGQRDLVDRLKASLQNIQKKDTVL